MHINAYVHIQYDIPQTWKYRYTVTLAIREYFYVYGTSWCTVDILYKTAYSCLIYGSDHPYRRPFNSEAVEHGGGACNYFFAARNNDIVGGPTTSE